MSNFDDFHDDLRSECHRLLDEAEIRDGGLDVRIASALAEARHWKTRFEAAESDAIRRLRDRDAAWAIIDGLRMVLDLKAGEGLGLAELTECVKAINVSGDAVARAETLRAELDAAIVRAEKAERIVDAVRGHIDGRATRLNMDCVVASVMDALEHGDSQETEVSQANGESQVLDDIDAFIANLAATAEREAKKRWKWIAEDAKRARNRLEREYGTWARLHTNEQMRVAENLRNTAFSAWLSQLRAGGMWLGLTAEAERLADAMEKNREIITRAALPPFQEDVIVDRDELRREGASQVCTEIEEGLRALDLIVPTHATPQDLLEVVRLEMAEQREAADRVAASAPVGEGPKLAHIESAADRALGASLALAARDLDAWPTRQSAEGGTHANNGDDHARGHGNTHAANPMPEVRGQRGHGAGAHPQRRVAATDPGADARQKALERIAREAEFFEAHVRGCAELLGECSDPDRCPLTSSEWQDLQAALEDAAQIGAIPQGDALEPAPESPTDVTLRCLGITEPGWYGLRVEDISWTFEEEHFVGGKRVPMLILAEVQHAPSTLIGYQFTHTDGDLRVVGWATSTEHAVALAEEDRAGAPPQPAGDNDEPDPETIEGLRALLSITRRKLERTEQAWKADRGIADAASRRALWWRRIGWDAALVALERGDITEGQASQMLGLDRVRLRWEAEKLRAQAAAPPQGDSEPAWPSTWDKGDSETWLRLKHVRPAAAPHGEPGPAYWIDQEENDQGAIACDWGIVVDGRRVYVQTDDSNESAEHAIASHRAAVLATAAPSAPHGGPDAAPPEYSTHEWRRVVLALHAADAAWKDAHPDRKAKAMAEFYAACWAHRATILATPTAPQGPEPHAVIKAAREAVDARVEAERLMAAAWGEDGTDHYALAWGYTKPSAEALAAALSPAAAPHGGDAGPGTSAAEKALDDIAALCGCPEWDYPGQVPDPDCPVHGGPPTTQVAKLYAEAAERGRISRLAALRAQGWTVASHNDYRIGGEPRTFWLLTRGRGHMEAVKGEGRDDAEAFAEIEATLTTVPAGLNALDYAARPDDWASLAPLQAAAKALGEALK
jgi:hypothetical protein